MKYHDATRGCLIEAHHDATAAYWDQKWRDDPIGAFDRRAVQPYLALTAQHLRPGARILEGGCGTAGKVAALLAEGYRVTGVDYARATVARVQAARPQWDVQLGDVFKLEFADKSFDGYWSFGVIEHFWHGYQDLVTEAFRVLRPGGHLFLTFPAMSPLRKAKAALGLYRRWTGGHGITASPPAGFYQFMLDPDRVALDLALAGFVVDSSCLIQASHGLKNEAPRLWRTLGRLGHCLPSAVRTRMADGLERHLAARWGHIALMSARKP